MTYSKENTARSIRLNLKQQKFPDKLTQIMLVMTINGTRLRVYTRLRVEPRYWDSERYRCKLQGRINLRDRQRLKYLNEQIDRLISRICETDELLANRGDYLTVPELRQLVGESSRMERQQTHPLQYLRVMAIDYVKNINRKGLKGIESTCTTYLMAVERLSRFVEEQGMVLHSFSDFNKHFFERFMEYLYNYTYAKGGTIHHYTQTTIVNTMKVIKNLLHRAYDGDLTTNDYFRKVQTSLPTDCSEQIYLDEEEVKQLSEVEVHNEHERQVRDLFYIGCYTALRISDLMQLGRATISHSTIELYQQKTKEIVSIPILKEIAPLIEKYRAIGFPKIHSSSANLIIKRLAARCHLNTPISRKEYRGGQVQIVTEPKYKLVSFHTARRSCITNLYRRGYSANYIMTLSGHRSPQAFQRYMKASRCDLSSNFLQYLKQVNAI